MTGPRPPLLEFQRGYFSSDDRTVRIAPGETPVVRRHLQKTLDPLALPPGARVLELGCGMGRFTAALLARGYQVTALDLSEYLIDRLRSAFDGVAGLTAIAGRAEDVADLTEGPFDAVVGFFFLHHLKPLAPTFDAFTRVLRPGAQVAFCEPNAFNPLVYLQVTFTPGMSWKGEPSIPSMRPSVVGRLFEERGYSDVRTFRYGMLPPQVANRAVGARLERTLEALPPLRPFSAYRVFQARRGGAPGSL
jgi:SAM-dependent methyltransferase